MTLPDPPPDPSGPPEGYEFPKGVIFDSNVKKWFFNSESSESYQYNFVLKKWTPLRVTEDVDEEDNKKDIRKYKKQKIEELKQERNRGLKKRENTGIVFVSNLPQSTTKQDLIDTFSKYGLIMEDYKDGTPKITLLNDSTGKFKGEALITYLNRESVDLAIEMLDDTLFSSNANDSRIKVKMASLEEENQVKSLSEEEKRLLQKKTEQLRSRLVNWDDDKVSSDKTDLIKQKIWDKTVVIENMFRIQEVKKDSMLEMDIKDDIQDECDRIGIGSDIFKIILYDESGVVTVKFLSPQSSSKCIEAFDGRWYDGLKLKVKKYQGEKYKKFKKDENESQRLDTFGKWIESNA